jgi:hypothetical protein
MRTSRETKVVNSKSLLQRPIVGPVDYYLLGCVGVTRNQFSVRSTLKLRCKAVLASGY